MSQPASEPAPEPGLLPAGEPALAAQRLCDHRRRVRPGAGRGRLPLHGLRLTGGVRVGDRRLCGAGAGAGEGSSDPRPADSRRLHSGLGCAPAQPAGLWSNGTAV